jgi:DeoR family transcriptional regulator of aga operon
MLYDVPQPTTATRSPGRGSEALLTSASVAAAAQQAGWLAISSCTWVTGSGPHNSYVLCLSSLCGPNLNNDAQTCVYHARSVQEPAYRSTHVGDRGGVGSSCSLDLLGARCEKGKIPAVPRYERWNALIDLLSSEGRLNVEDAAKKFGVSASTIRRDLEQLAQQQVLSRARGGAVASNVSYDLPLRYKTTRHASEKQRIAMAAAAMVPAGATVCLNGGTTTTEVARAIATRADLLGSPNDTALTIVTNALNIANELVVRPRVKVVVTGGVIRPQSYELIGPLATPLLAEISLDFAIIGVNGIDPSAGATAQHEGEASINQLMVSRARQTVVVADSSKLEVVAFARICSIDRVAVLVTDSGADERVLAMFGERGVRVVTA